MSVAETVLVYAVIPLAIALVLAALVFLPGGHKKRPRYRPGQPWEHEPIWYEPHPEGDAASGHGAQHGAEGTAIASSVYPERRAIGSGGGDHGTSTATAPAPAPAAGPLGGARGTW